MTARKLDPSILGVVYGLHLGDHVYRYIGLTTQKPSVRLYDHRRDARRGMHRPVSHWIRKHGPENIQMEILVTFTEETLPQIGDVEMQLIEKYQTHTSKNGMNQTLGGDGGIAGYKHTPESIAKMSASVWTGRKHSEESRRKMSESSMGKTISDEHKAKLAIAFSGENNHNYGKPMSDESKAKLSATQKARMSTPEGKFKQSRSSHIYWHVQRDIIKEGCIHCAA